MKHALITGITGQDGSYLAELLLEKGYEVYGIMRRKSVVDYGNVEHIKDKIHLVYGDMTDLASLQKAMDCLLYTSFLLLAGSARCQIAFMCQSQRNCGHRGQCLK